MRKRQTRTPGQGRKRTNNDHVTAPDTTPFALAEKRGRRTRREMRRWICAAGTERLNHLALMRESAPSLAFVRRQFLVLAVAALVFELSHAGWHLVIRTPDNAPILSASPASSGWMLLSSVDMMPDDFGCVAVWWSPARSAVAVVPGLIAGILLAYTVMGVVRFGAQVLAGRDVREEERLGAGLRYSTAWFHPLMPAALVMLSVPTVNALRASAIPLVPPPVAFLAVAAVLTGVAGFMWWFMLVRLAQTLPIAVRARVTGYYVLVAPVLITALIVGWRYGMECVYDLLWISLNLRW